MRIKMCAGCQKKLYGSDYEMFRGKTFCGETVCKEIIDIRRSQSNRKKKNKRREKGTIYRGVNSTIRKKVLKRDDHHCVICGGDDQIQVHHIVPASQGGSDNLRNLITLCHKDHDLVHEDIGKYEYLLTHMANRRESARKREQGI